MIDFEVDITRIRVYLPLFVYIVYASTIRLALFTSLKEHEAIQWKAILLEQVLLSYIGLRSESSLTRTQDTAQDTGLTRV